MLPQRSLIPTVCSLHTQEEEQFEYGVLQKKLQGYKEVLKLVQKSNEDDRRNLMSRRSSNGSCDILQLTESQDDDKLVAENAQLQRRVSQLEEEVRMLQREVHQNKQSMISTAAHMEELNQQREQLFDQVQQLKSELDQKNQKSFINNTLLDMTYECENTQDYGRKRIKSLKGGKSVVFDDNKRIIDELSEVLKSENIVKEVVQMQQVIRKQDKFISCIQDMVKKLTPKDMFSTKKPTLRDCWKWIKHILNEYMNLKRSNVVSIVQRIQEVLRVPEEEIVDTIQQMVLQLIRVK